MKHTSEQIGQMRNWVAENIWQMLVVDPSSASAKEDWRALSDEDIVQMIEEYYEGGSKQFVVDINQPRPELSPADDELEDHELENHELDEPDHGEWVEWQDLPWGGDDDFASWDAGSDEW